MIEAPDRIATALLRLGLDPRRGRVGRQRVLAVGLRAALFADLALAGALTDDGRGPVVAGPAPPDDRILAALHAAVAARPRVAWHRWYRHVAVDLHALTGELAACGQWHSSGQRRFADTAPAAVIELGRRAQAVGEGTHPPADVREAVLGVLAVATGAVSGRTQPRVVRELPARLALFGEITQPPLRTTVSAVSATRRLLRPGLLRRH